MIKNSKQIKTPKEIQSLFPLEESIKKQIKKDTLEIENILAGVDDRLLLIIGPCSAWPSEAVISYAKELKKIEEKVKDKIKIVMRVYTQKPRTTIGWTGPLFYPNPLKEHDAEKGIIYCRKMMLEILKLGLPIADEALFTHNYGYFDCLLSWVAIGARSTEDQEHRAHASMLEIPVGIKNPTSGDIVIGVNSILSAQSSHTMILHQKEVNTTGNPFAHLIMRGGNNKPNISKEKLMKAVELLRKTKNPSIIIDASHDNSIDESGNKNPLLQPKIIFNTLKLMKKDPFLKKTIKGFMVESFIKSGKQPISENMDLKGLSITDACIGLDETKEMIRKIYELL